MATDSEPMLAIVLAAGQGTRMRSVLPKPLHPVCGRPMVSLVIDTISDLDAVQVCVVVGHGGDDVVNAVRAFNPFVSTQFVEQPVQRGTGDAVQIAMQAVAADDRDGLVVVVPGDAPLLRSETLRALVDHHLQTDSVATLLTACLDDPTGYGRVLRDDTGHVVGIVEQADATPEQIALNEVNTSMYCFSRAHLHAALAQITSDNAQGELYLTDVIGVLHGDGQVVEGYVMDDAQEAQGVNDRVQLAQADTILRERIIGAHLRAGVSLPDPGSVIIEPTVVIEPDVTLHPGSVLKGTTTVERGAVIGPDTELVDAHVGAGATVWRSVAMASVIGDNARLGPYVVVEAGGVVHKNEVVRPFTLIAEGSEPTTR